jgi:hypothetical protein
LLAAKAGATPAVVSAIAAAVTTATVLLRKIVIIASCLADISSSDQAEDWGRVPANE